MKPEGVIEALGGGLAATIVGWFLSKSDSARERKQKAIEAVAAKVISDALEAAEIESRLVALETQLREVHDKLDQILVGGYLHGRKDDE